MTSNIFQSIQVPEKVNIKVESLRIQQISEAPVSGLQSVWSHIQSQDDKTEEFYKIWKENEAERSEKSKW